MSGTSLDGIDAVVTDFSGSTNKLICSDYQPYPQSTRQKIQQICSGDASISSLAEMDTILGKLYAKSVLAVLKKSALNKADILAIGNHGQTVCHQPLQPNPCTLQIGDPNLLAELTGIPVVADFRRRDISVGGQGAPLVPAFHQAIFHSSTENRAIINIGGIANITHLPSSKSEQIVGFDCGPGNTLMDFWTETHHGKSYDHNGDWAKSGKVNLSLLKLFLTDPFFTLSPPKSTGTDYFSAQWLQNMLSSFTPQITNEDIQATLVELTAQSIVTAIKTLSSKKTEIYICGGGTKNGYLMERLSQLSGNPSKTTESLSVHPDWVEAMAFAWLARQTVNGLPGNLPEVTGASRSVILGGIYNP